MLISDFCDYSDVYVVVKGTSMLSLKIMHQLGHEYQKSATH